MRETEETSAPEAAIGETVWRRLASATIPALAAQGPVAVDPDLADEMGAFEETALSEEDALDSLVDEIALSAEGGAHG
ncbi:conjugal transfer protein, TraD [Tepidicaulis marinus]|uniref:Conjugal transfer protein, TraD n=1 Tax=Tepidicaulis marinus TaxID=1333998 RepID=A0A081B652_9HYPH|nr:hypothetical protein [Tepidicaulis marinus]GAK43520.1 conjugal transfer protein, TraD [Tepidicaulis marinus]